MKFPLTAACLFILVCSQTILAANELYELPGKNVVTRWASAENWDAKPGEAGMTKMGRKGSAATNIQSGACLTLAHAEGSSGIIRRIWMTISDRNPEQLRGLVIRMYWDGCRKPAVEAPLGDFFCMPLGKMTRFENAWFDTAEGRSFNCRVPMPFRKGFKITLTNETDKALRLCFYDVDFTLGDEVTPKTGYFHAHFRREMQTTPGKDFEILPYLKGEGRYLGCNLGVLVNSEMYGTLWWGEGEVKIYLDGDKDYPTLCGTGTEDYIATGWGEAEFADQWHCCPFADKGRAYGFYRLHGPDPVFFHKDIRVTIQQLGIALKQQAAEVLKAGKLSEMTVAQTGQKLTAANIDSQDLGRNFLFDRSDDWCATTYFYLNQPEDSLPEIAPYSARIAGLLTPMGGQTTPKSNQLNPADPK